MKKLAYLINVFSISLLFCSCERLDIVGLFAGQSPNNDARFEQSLDYFNKYGHQPNGQSQILLLTDNYKVYYATDSHVNKSWNNLSKWCSMAEKDIDCSFGIVLGDLIDAKDNYPNFIKGMEPLNKPWYVTAGNHDLYFGQWKDFANYFGTSVYTFEVVMPNATDLYICLDSGDGTLGTKQLQWLKDQLASAAQKDYRHKVVFTHTHIFKRDGSQGHTSNFALEETYEILDLLGKNGVDWYVSGHDHAREVTHFKDVTYIIVDAITDTADYPEYMVATVGRKMSYEFIDMN